MMIRMMATIAMGSAFPSLAGKGCGADVAVDDAGVTVNVTSVAVEIGCAEVGVRVGAGCVAVAVTACVGADVGRAGESSGVFVLVGRTDVVATSAGVLVAGTSVAGTLPGVSVGDADVSVTGIGVLMRVGIVWRAGD